MVPASWRLEVANAFQAAIRHERIDAIYRDASLAELAMMPITIDPDTSTYACSATLRLVERFSLPAYDAAYLELANRHSLPLATLNRGLATAAEELGLTLAEHRPCQWANARHSGGSASRS